MASPKSNFADRFWERVDVGPSSKCWNWKSHCFKRGGHGIARSEDGRTATAHRVAFTLYNGPPAPGMVLAHSCDNPKCCNPGHLRAVPQAENVADMIRKGRGVWQKKAKIPGGGERKERLAPAPHRLPIPPSLLSKRPRGPIVSVVGAPGAGKSELLSMVDPAGLGFRVISLTKYTEKFFDNHLAWEVACNDAVTTDGPVLIESSGLSVSLKDLRIAAGKQGRGFRTILVTAPMSSCMARIDGREGGKVVGVSFTTAQLVEDCFKKLFFHWPDAGVVHNDDGQQPEAATRLRGLLESTLKRRVAPGDQENGTAK